MTRELTLTVEEGKPNYMGGAHSRHNLLDIERARRLIRRLLSRIGGVADQHLAQEDFPEGSAPVRRRLRRDGAECWRHDRIRGLLLEVVELGVVVRKRDCSEHKGRGSVKRW